MRKSLVVALSLFMVLLASSPLLAQDDVARVKSCKFCGMDRDKYATSRVFIEYTDGSVEGLCSLRCAAVEMALSLDKFARAVGVGDQATRALIDAETSVWVMGGKLPGVMTKRPKWAFATKDAAEVFIAANGGAILTFDEAIKAAYEDLYQDTKMIRERREAKRKAAGEMK